MEKTLNIADTEHAVAYDASKASFGCLDGVYMDWVVISNNVGELLNLSLGDGDTFKFR